MIPKIVTDGRLGFNSAFPSIHVKVGTYYKYYNQIGILWSETFKNRERCLY